MTLTETITQELLDSTNSQGGAEAVLARYGHSKGPLYAALGRATSVLTEPAGNRYREPERS